MQTWKRLLVIASTVGACYFSANSFSSIACCAFRFIAVLVYSITQTIACCTIHILLNSSFIAVHAVFCHIRIYLCPIASLAYVLLFCRMCVLSAAYAGNRAKATDESCA